MAPKPTLTDDQKTVRKWKKEIDLAGKREKEWRAEADKILKRYKGTKRKANSFNILWANTEILRPALYNSRPSPDVRRRFRDVDPTGKAVSELLERGLSVVVDQDSTDQSIKHDVLDALLQGRGISRIRYIPKISAVPRETDADAQDFPNPSTSQGDGASDSDLKSATQGAYGAAQRSSSGPDDDDDELLAEADEELEFEQVDIEHVDWNDFRHGFARTWAEVPWVGFRCKLTQAESEDKFGHDAVAEVKFADMPADEDPDRTLEAQSEVSKTAQFWEIWDKTAKKVFFTTEGIQSLLYPLANPDGTPPLDFCEFFPCPKPLYIIEDSTSTIPIPLFSLYEEQANELDKLTFRISKIVNALKVRGVYDATLPEMKGVMDGQDNDLIPISKAQAWMTNGGLEKAISWMPIDVAAKVLQILMGARDAAKAIIYELTGISDILRGASDPDETLGAQNIKAGYGGMRLQRMQREVQRYARDLLRMCAEVMASKFEQETLADMTGLQFPTQAQQMQAQMASMPPAIPPPGAGMPPPGVRPGTPGGPPPMMNGAAPPMPPPGVNGAAPPQPGGPAMPPPMPPAPDPGLQAMMALPTWEAIMALMHDKGLSAFKIDVETDSTVQGSIQSDMQGLSQVLQSVGQTLQIVTPLVQQHVLPLDAAKEMIMAVIRRAKMGMAVEDAFDKLQAPPPPPPAPPPPDPHGHAIQVATIQAQADVQREAAKQQAETQRAAMKHEAQAQAAQLEQNAEDQRKSIEARMEMLLEANKAQLQAAVDVITAQIAATKAPSAVTPIAEEEFRAQVIPTQAAPLRVQFGLPATPGPDGHLPPTASQPGAPTPPVGPAAMPNAGMPPVGASAVDPNAPPPEPPPDPHAALLGQVIAHMNRPRKVVRDAAGKIIGVE